MPAPTDVDDEIVLPDAPAAPTRPALPLFASIVPVAGAVGLWAVTGSVLSLWFAALGPLIAAASLVDGARTAHRARHAASAAAVAARAMATAEIARRHAIVRARLERRHPDASAFVLGAAEPWRGAGEVLVIGRGGTASGVRVRGGAGDDASRAVRAHAATLDDAPVAVPATGVVTICGPPALADAVVRALVVQLCSAQPPTELRVTGRVAPDHWSARLPHRRGTAARTLAFGAAETVARDGVDLAVVGAGPDAVPPPGSAVVVRMTGALHGVVDGPDGEHRLALEALSVEQAVEAVAALAERAGELGSGDRAAPVAFADLVGVDLPREGLAVAIGLQDGHPAVVDLVADGPHAVVVGVTGAGKSELLATWVAALCRGRGTDEVTVLLADFKGGTTFHALAALPHVTGVITDLDDAAARRAIESLRAEIRRREAALTAAGARDAGDPRARLSRLVIVVDEFAALLGAHPELQAVFADVAARGRALGMHLVLGTQRATGVIRDGLLANCPLRIALRVTDPSDARLVTGAPDAASLPGDAASRGLAYVRRSGDDRAQLVRIALTSAADVAGIAASAGPAPAARPWLPPLPDAVTLEELDGMVGNPAAEDVARGHDESSRLDGVGAAGGSGLRELGRAPGDLVLGLIDDPAAQRRRVALLGAAERGLVAFGGAGSGKTSLAALVAAQVPARRLVRIPRDPEAAWDVVAHLAATPPDPGVVVVLDDADALPTRFPADHGREVAERIERLAREAGDLGIRIVATAQRPLGLAGRLAELLPRRLVLGIASRSDHIAAGGDATGWRPRVAPGRASLDGLELQVATVADDARPDVVEAAEPWRPERIAGLVIREGAAAVVAACRDLGVAARPVDEVARDERAALGPLVVWGDPEEWQRHRRVLALVQGEGELVVDAGCAAELRLLTGLRGLPPYCRPGAGRAWRVRPDGLLDRVMLPGRRRPDPRREAG